MALSSRGQRAAATLALVIGFYFLALALVGLLLVIPYWQLTHRSFAGAKIGLACVGAAFVILRGICPRPDPSFEPGPRLERGDHPALFQMLEEVAADTGQSMPENVYLLPDVNAFVGQQGGFLGIGSRRIMGIGLPLMALTTAKQFRGVIAHEFGHFEAGDTKLAVISAQGHKAIDRTVTDLIERDSWLQKPLIWYGRLFERAMNAISRTQEFAADAMGARLVGARIMQEGMTRIEMGTQVAGTYWSQEVAPLLSQGYLPPLADGLHRFLAAPEVAFAIGRTMKQSEVEEPDPYATHPPFSARMQALAALEKPDEPQDPGDPSLNLLREPAREEQRLAEFLFPEQNQEWRTLPWERVGEEAYLAMWEEGLAKNRAALQGLTFADLFALCADPTPLIGKLRTPGELPEREQMKGQALYLLIAAVAVRLWELGWTISAEVGEPIRLIRLPEVVEPVRLIRRLANREMSEEEFAELNLPSASLVGDAAAASS